MELKRDGKLARWAYFFDQSGYRDGDYFGNVPHQTSLCALFWRAFVGVPLLMLVHLFIVVTILFLIGMAVWHYWHTIAWVAAALLIAALLTLLISWVLHRTLDATPGDAAEILVERIADSVFVQGLKAVKGKMCPIIKFTSDEGD